MKKEKGKSKHMKIKLEAETGKNVEVVDDDGDDAPDIPAQELDPDQLEQMYTGLGGFEYVGIVLHSHASPG